MPVIFSISRNRYGTILASSQMIPILLGYMGYMRRKPTSKCDNSGIGKEVRKSEQVRNGLFLNIPLKCYLKTKRGKKGVGIWRIYAELEGSCYFLRYKVVRIWRIVALHNITLMLPSLSFVKVKTKIHYVLI